MAFNTVQIGAPLNQRNLVDYTLRVSGSTGNTSTLDFEVAQPYSTTEHFVLNVVLGPMSSSATIYSGSVQLKDSADNSTFAVIPGLAPLVSLSTSGTASVVSQRYSLPPSTRRYVRGEATFTSASVTVSNITSSMVITPLF